MTNSTNKTTLRIIAAVVDTRALTLYLEDGDTYTIQQGDSRLRPIVEQITPILTIPGQVAEITLEKDTTHYQSFEEQTNGFVRFFKVAKSKIASLFGAKDETDTVEPQIIGQVSISQDKMSAAIDDIMANARPADHQVEAHETVVAVVDGKTVVPGVENISKQVKLGASLGSTKGLEAFFDRIAKVITQRQHSVEDLLKFLEKGDLPIADDGSIVIYKVLNRSNDCYVDCHTHRVKQRVGSYVCMDPSMVDHNRRQECSNGLHVARRGYLRGFSGNVCVLAKVAPEDVIAVPYEDANKMRVCGYHILSELPDAAYDKLKANRSMVDIPEAQQLLADALSGNHVGKLEEVRINGHMGSDVVITPLDASGHPIPVPTAEASLEKAVTIEEENTIGAPSVNPNEIASKVMAAKTNDTKSTPGLSPNQYEARTLFDAGKFAELRDFKKARKKSWTVLGFTEAEVDQIMGEAPAQPAKVDPLADFVPSGNERKDTARKLFLLEDWAGLYSFKRKAKVNWDRLGFNSVEVTEILSNQPLKG